MPEHDSTSIGAAVDAAYRRQHGTDQPVEELSAEQVEAARREQEEAQLERLANPTADKSGRDRLLVAHRAMIDASTSFRHGEPVDAEDRAELVDEVVAAIGGNASPNVRKTIQQAVDAAAKLAADGEMGRARQRLEDAAATIAELPGTIRRPKIEPGDADDPATLAAMIGRG
jgi:hypothetical protein